MFGSKMRAAAQTIQNIRNKNVIANVARIIPTIYSNNRESYYIICVYVSCKKDSCEHAFLSRIE